MTRRDRLAISCCFSARAVRAAWGADAHPRTWKQSAQGTRARPTRGYSSPCSESTAQRKSSHNIAGAKGEREAQPHQDGLIFPLALLLIFLQELLQLGCSQATASRLVTHPPPRPTRRGEADGPVARSPCRAAPRASRKPHARRPRAPRGARRTITGSNHRAASAGTGPARACVERCAEHGAARRAPERAGGPQTRDRAAPQPTQHTGLHSLVWSSYTSPPWGLAAMSAVRLRVHRRHPYGLQIPPSFFGVAGAPFFWSDPPFFWPFFWSDPPSPGTPRSGGGLERILHAPAVAPRLRAHAGDGVEDSSAREGAARRKCDCHLH